MKLPSSVIPDYLGSREHKVPTVALDFFVGYPYESETTTGLEPGIVWDPLGRTLGVYSRERDRGGGGGNLLTGHLTAGK